MYSELDEEGLQDLYAWVDKIPLSRPKRNITRDFSDGVLVAEVVKFYFPRLVEMHNYVPASATHQKFNNWAHLNRKVFSKLNFYLPEDVIWKTSQCSPGVVELVLHTLRHKLEEKQKQKLSKTTSSSQELETRASGEKHNGNGIGNSPVSSKPKIHSTGNNIQQSQQTTEHSAVSLGKAQQGYVHTTQRDSDVRMLLKEKEQALLASQEAIKVQYCHFAM
ncbi:sperm flagellar protein 1 [Latimeria chalumnae]|uniref:Sperm flagellar 1 n=1 Tax=Latimeria chalumnae TaxID=7897 RepID=M3XIV4_LATCH